jgi:hypothetical protein
LTSGQPAWLSIPLVIAGWIDGKEFVHSIYRGFPSSAHKLKDAANLAIR